MKYTIVIVAFIISTSLNATTVKNNSNNKAGIDGLITISFPTPQDIASTYDSQCNLQTIDAIGFPVMCQQFGSIIFKAGKNKITKIGLRSIIKSSIDPFGLLGDKDNLKKRIAVGTGLLIAGATIVATCPPISVNKGFHQLTSLEKLQQAQAFGYIPSAPANLDLDVNNILNPTSCTSSLNISIDESTREVTNFGDFNEREFAYVSPFGSYPSAAADLAHIPAAIVSCTDSMLSLVDISFGPSVGGGFINAPDIPDVNLNDLLSGLFDLILETIGLSEFENVALSHFSSWKNDFKHQNSALEYCKNGICQFEHGDTRMKFYENMPASAWGNVTPSVAYNQDITVMEYFKPEITALPLEVHLEALEIGGVTVNAYPPRTFSGNPPANKNYTFDKSWLGLQDNCTTQSELELELEFEPADFYPLGNWDIPISITDRVGNITTGSMRIVVEDSIPPDLLPLDAVGIPVADGTTVIKFNDAGIGCTEYLCEGFPADKYLFPPTYFDFASINPDIECFVDNVLSHDLNNNLIPCTVAEFPVNDVSLITWRISDPSGNVTEIIQEVFVREQSFNQAPTVSDVSITIGQNAQVQIPLSGNDADYDPLNFNIASQPNNGNLDADVEAIFQTRFTTSGMIRSASGIIMLSTQAGDRGILLSVPDEKRLYVFRGDLFSIGAEVVNRYDLPTITPSAISMSNSKKIESSHDSLYQVLRPTSAESGIWIADWPARKVYRYTYNDLSDISVEKEIFTLPAGLQQPSGLAVEQSGSNYKVLIADKQDNELWKFELSRTGSTYTLISSTVVGVLPFAVDAMDKWNSNNNTTDSGEIIIASWSAKELVWFDWDNGISESWNISSLVDDPDGPNNPGLPILQDPRDIVLINDGTNQMQIVLFDQAELKYTEKDFNKTGHTVTCGGPQSGNSIYCPNPESDVLRLPAMVDILAIEEHNELIYILDKNTIGYQHLYRFDLAGRLDAVINLYDNAPSPNALSPTSQTEYVDLALMDNGHILLLEEGDNNNVPSIHELTVNTGVDKYFIHNSFTVNTNTSNNTVALDVNASNIVVLMSRGFVNIPLNDVFNQIQIVQYTTSNIYSDLSLSDSGEIFASNILQAPFSHVTRFQIGGAFISFIGDDDNDGDYELDFNLDANYGKIYFDNTLNKLWVTDFADIFYPDLGTNGETHRMPRISAYSPDGTLLERLMPNGDPNDFFSFLDPGDFGNITSLSVGSNRFYVAENAPLHRLHVFDTAPFIPVTCTNLPDGEVCQEIGYTPDNGFVGSETFTYTSSDPFAASSNVATVTINVINDTQAPILNCPTSIQLEMNNTNGFVAILAEPEKEPNATMRNFLLGISLTENTDLPVVEATHNIPVALPLGATTIEYLATDGSNNTGSCATMITIVDTTAPSIAIIADKIIEATSLLTPVLDISLAEPVVNDFSPYVLSNDAPMEFPLGQTIVTWSASDNQGNQNSFKQVITLKDTTPPEFKVAATYSDIINSTVETSITYTLPQATDAVGINDAGVVCIPAIGNAISMGPTLVQCNVSDSFGNKSSTSFTINYYDSDSDSNGIINVLDQGNNQFSDSNNGGQTNGQINDSGDYVIKIYDAPLLNGLTIGLKSATTSKKVLLPTKISACNNKLTMNNLNNEIILFDDISVEVFDHVVVTCTTNGLKLFSLLGNNDFNIKLPDNTIATTIFEFNNSLEIDNWIAKASPENRSDISINTPLGIFLLKPGETKDLSYSDVIFVNGFD